mmetsp:Transcript_53105/g.126687  ORF Transcript_53105/g.126687 Transcript_53105/m.126687 type:complete len:350 (+) Transcript_53105:111-1160(+)
MPAFSSARRSQSMIGRTAVIALVGLGALSSVTSWERDLDATSFVPLGRSEAPVAAMGGRFVDAGSSSSTMSLRGLASSRQFATQRANYVSTMKSPKDSYFSTVETGLYRANMSARKKLHASIMGGCYVAFAGLLALSISGNMQGITASNPGIQRMIFAALFPMNLLLVLNSGAQLVTGNAMTVPAAVFEGLATWRSLWRTMVISSFGNFIGCVGIAALAVKCGLVVDGTKALALTTLVKKTSIPLMETLIRAVFCNWLVCMAIFMASSASDMAGRMVGIWFPISTFVAIGFEHSVANMFLLPLGIFAGGAVSWKAVFLKNLLPVFVGNIVGGAVIVAMGFSYQFGRLGQ